VDKLGILDAGHVVFGGLDHLDRGADPDIFFIRFRINKRNSQRSVTGK